MHVRGVRMGLRSAPRSRRKRPRAMHMRHSGIKNSQHSESEHVADIRGKGYVP